MQAELADEYPVVRDTWQEAGDLLGYDLWALVQAGPADRLDVTEVTQPAMLAAGVAAWRAWRAASGPEPAALAGHSLGEYTALVCSGSLAFADAVPLVEARGGLMQAAVPADQGAMAAILGLDDDAVLAVCRDASAEGVAEAVNFNSPGQVVISGERTAIEKAVELAQAAGARRAILLSVSVPSHSSLMRGAAEKLAEKLESTEFGAPDIEVLSSVEVRPYRDAADMRELLTRQVYSPVQWAKTTAALIEGGADRILECGPGKVLAGLTRRIDRSVSAACLDAPDAIAKALAPS